MSSFCSISMVCFRKGNNDRLSLFKKSLASLVENTTYPYELILMDNTEVKRTLFEARQEAFERSHGDYFCFIDDDIAVLPGWLEECIEILSFGSTYLATPVHSRGSYGWWKRWLRDPVHGHICHLRSGSSCMVMRRDQYVAIPAACRMDQGKIGGRYQDQLIRRGYKVLMTLEEKALNLGEKVHSYK